MRPTNAPRALQAQFSASEFVAIQQEGAHTLRQALARRSRSNRFDIACDNMPAAMTANKGTR